ncbi:uncharacterized protein LOC131239682 [Magnolia sinica]|uniref:uncharacterized protein LOC131239682 n=1 Tax=Magnolia sinica TaxID=86752 RepID=UPI00265A1904|nr:uncharacterized protein LOC131239682 [Magnolia sinica]
MHYKNLCQSNSISTKMAATAPVEIGTRGTIGSLLSQEIEYFRRLELDRRNTPQRPWLQIAGARSGSCSSSGPNSGFVVVAQKKKKKRSSGGFLPSICSAVEVADSRVERMPGFSYRNLKTDIKKGQG